MARARMFAVRLGAALFSLSLAPMAFAQDTVEQPAAENVAPVFLEQFGIEIQPSAALSVEQLETRIKELAAVLEQNGLTNDAKKQLRAQLKADRGELKQRQAMAEGQAVTTEAPLDQAAEQPIAATTQPAETTGEKQAEPAVEGEPVAATAQPADATGEKQPEPSAEGQPVAATPEQTNAPAADTAPKTQAPLDQAEIDAAAPKLAAPLDADAPLQVNPQAETRALALLADTTSIDSLSNVELKARVEEYRDLLREPELSPKTAKALRQRLKVDRETLRVRVAKQNATQTEAQTALARQPEKQVQPAQEQTQQVQPATTQNQQDLKKELKSEPVEPAVTAVPRSTLALLRVAPLLPTVIAPTAQEIPLILEDQRPAQVLAVDELSRRILAARAALQDNRLYSEDALQQFRQQLQADRTDLSDRLLADRNQRADIYDQFEQADDLDFVNGNGSDSGVLQPLNSIFAAEVNDDEMWNQLVSSPLGPIQHRYTRQEVMEEPEIVMNLPEVRETMPSIELDTIAFGFNEAFMREEEIFDLDRIARMIERVVAAHPDEIFMIEGHTDAVGSDAYNLNLSRQRAEAVAAALTRYYVIKPENLATVGLGERYLRIWTPEAEEENRRVTVRRVTPLMQGYEGAG